MQALAEVHKSPDGLFFVENKGQWNDDIFYRMDMGYAKIDLERTRLNFLLISPEDLEAKHHRHIDRSQHCHDGEEHHDHEDLVMHFHRFYVNFLGANPTPTKKPKNKYTAYHNYFIGNDKSKWASNVALYEEASYGNLYDGIDMRLYQFGGNMKYDFIIAPNADPNQILLEYEHADKVFLKDKKLHIQTSVNEVVEQEPFAYQVIDGLKTKVACEFRLVGNQLTFDFPKGYDKNLELVIDPELIFASYSGASGDNWGTTATFDEDGNLYGAGVAFDRYPTTAGAFDTTDPNIFSFDSGNMGISKFSADGRNLIYSTYLGGGRMEVPHSMIVNSKDQLVILGSTSSDDYPMQGAFDSSFGGGRSVSVSGSYTYPDGSDIVITILNPRGSALVGSTFVGGSQNDGLHFRSSGSSLNYSDEIRGEVVVDNLDNIYVASTTYSNNFPLGSGGFQNTFAQGDEDAIVFKMNPTASSLEWGTYLGGRGFDAAFSLQFDESNNIYVCGVTNSSDFPTSSTAINRTLQGSNSDGFVARISSDGKSLLAATYFNGSDYAYFVDLDSEGDVYVIGQANSGTYPITAGVYNNQRSSLFLHKLNPSLSSTEFSTVLGNGDRVFGTWIPSAFLVDNCKRIYISGWGGATNGGSIRNMPVTPDAFQRNTDGSDFYLMVLEPDARDLEYATYFGGSRSDEHVDGGTSRFDKRGIIYQAVCAGCRGFSDFPTTPGAVSNTNGSGNCNLGVFKFDFQFNRIIVEADADPELAGCAPFDINFLNNSTGATDFLWDFGDGNTSTLRTPSHTFDFPGIYEVTLIASLPSSDCVLPDTTTLLIEAVDPPVGVNEDLTICDGDLTTLISTVGDPGVTYDWSNGGRNQSTTIVTGGTYYVEAMMGNGCPQTDSFYVAAIPQGTDITSFGLCDGIVATIASSNSRTTPGITYLWQDGTANSTLDIDDPGTYWVVSEEMGCEQIDTFIIFPDSIRMMTDILNINCIGQDSGAVAVQVMGGLGPYEFSLNSGDFQANSNYSGLLDGNYRVAARDVNGCYDETLFTITSPPEVETAIQGNLKVCLGDSTLLTAQTNLAFAEIDSIAWMGIDSMDCADCLTQMVRPVVNTTYQVFIQSADGCFKLDSVTVFVEPKKPVYIPSAFSPNNDGINDQFVVYAKANVVTQVKIFQVYDRWGELVFEEENFQPNDPAFGWDGMFRGDLMNNAVFAYWTEVEFIDGTSQIFEGDVTLVK